jgi:hypothetical protein
MLLAGASWKYHASRGPLQQLTCVRVSLVKHEGLAVEALALLAILLENLGFSKPICHLGMRKGWLHARRHQ